LLFSNKSQKKPGPKGPKQAVIDAILEMKNRNPLFGYYRITMQINIAFGTNIDKDIVRRILNKYGKPPPSNSGPSWLTFIEKGVKSRHLTLTNDVRCRDLTPLPKTAKTERK